jgi:hypothetical protein
VQSLQQKLSAEEENILLTEWIPNFKPVLDKVG